MCLTYAPERCLTLTRMCKETSTSHRFRVPGREGSRCRTSFQQLWRSLTQRFRFRALACLNWDTTVEAFRDFGATELLSCFTRLVSLPGLKQLLLQTCKPVSNLLDRHSTTPAKHLDKALHSPRIGPFDESHKPSSWHLLLRLSPQCPSFRKDALGLPREQTDIPRLQLQALSLGPSLEGFREGQAPSCSLHLKPEP